MTWTEGEGFIGVERTGTKFGASNFLIGDGAWEAGGRGWPPIRPIGRVECIQFVWHVEKRGLGALERQSEE